MTSQVPLVCGLYVFPLTWATTSAVSCNGVSCLMVFIWLNFHKDTYPSPMKSEPGKLFPWTKPKAAKLWSKTVMKAHLKLQRKLCLVIASWFGQSLFFMAAVQLKRHNLKDNIQCLLWLWLFLARGKGLGEILLSSTDRVDFLHLLDLARSCCFTDRGKKKSQPKCGGKCLQRSSLGPPTLDGRGDPLCSTGLSWLCGAKCCGCSQPGTKRVLAWRLDLQRVKDNVQNREGMSWVWPWHWNSTALEKCKNSLRCRQPAFILREWKSAEEPAEILPSHLAEAMQNHLLTFMNMQIGQIRLPQSGKGVAASCPEVSKCDNGAVLSIHAGFPAWSEFRIWPFGCITVRGVKKGMFHMAFKRLSLSPTLCHPWF